MFLRVQEYICKNADDFGMATGGSPGGEWF